MWLPACGCVSREQLAGSNARLARSSLSQNKGFCVSLPCSARMGGCPKLLLCIISASPLLCAQSPFSLAAHGVGHAPRAGPNLSVQGLVAGLKHQR